MRLLLLAAEITKQQVEVVFSSLAVGHSLQIEWLSDAKQGQLSSLIDQLGAAQYDRVLLWLPFQKIYSQIIALRKLPKLVVFDFNFHELASCDTALMIKRVKLHGALPWARFVVSGQKSQQWMESNHVEARWLPPFLDVSNKTHENEPSTKPINVCFLGPADYPDRKHREVLYQVRRELKLHIVDEGLNDDEQWTLLSKSLMCFCDDSSFGGLRQQTLKAFSSGCVVLLWASNLAECAELGLCDMDNVALVDSKASLLAKVSFLTRHRDQAERIAESGRDWVATLPSQARERLEAVLEPELGVYKGDNAWKGLKYLFYR